MVTHRKKNRQVTLHLFVLTAVIVTITTLVWAQSPLRITIIGDSTVCNYSASKYPQTGWGQLIQLFFTSGSVSVNNRAIGGRSTRSFYQEGRWAEIVPDLEAGEYVFIQFGHNDRDYSKAERYTDTTEYKEYLRKYVKESREKNAIPVLISPMNMNAWRGTTVRTVFREGENDYRGAMMNVAAELSVPFIDLEQRSVDMQKRVGQTYSAKFIHLGLDAGEYPNFPSGISDGTHFQEMGANFMAKFVCEGIRELENDTEIAPLAAVLKPLAAVGVSSNKSNIGMITESDNTFPEGVSITVKVKPNSGETFLGWFDASGKRVTSEKRYTFTMPSEAISHSARFEGGALQHSLSTSVAAGKGTIEPAAGSFDEGSTVSVTAVPDAGWLFERWEGDATGNENPTSVTMADDITLEAYFKKDTVPYYSVTVTTGSGGTISQNPAGNSLREHSTVTFIAVPSPRWKFNGWSGTCSGTDTLLTVEDLTQDFTLSAGFVPIDPVHYEAEHGVLHEAVIEEVNGGFSGTGYVNFNNTAGSSLALPVYSYYADELDVTITYTNGSSSARQALVTVNDTTVIDTLSFQSTGDWSTWKDKTISIPFKPGGSTITITSLSADGGPNIDKIHVEQLTGDVRCTGGMKNRHRIVVTDRMLRINNIAETVRLELFSIDGRNIYSESVAPTDGTIQLLLPTASIPQGHYILRIATRNRTSVQNFNFIK